MEEVVEERVVDAVRTFSPLMPANRRIEVRSTRCVIFVIDLQVARLPPQYSMVLRGECQLIY